MDHPVVLIVEDERDLADLYATWLSGDYAVRTAYGGEEALTHLDETVDVVLLDRRMPDLSGDTVLEQIRQRDLDCRVAMVTAVEPDFDIIEMGFDDYLTKPISEEDLHETVERLLTRSTYDQHVREYFALVSKKAALEAEKSPAQLENSDEYARLEREIADIRDQLDTTFDDVGESDLQAVLRDITRTTSDQSPSIDPENP